MRSLTYCIVLFLGFGAFAGNRTEARSYADLAELVPQAASILRGSSGNLPDGEDTEDFELGDTEGFKALSLFIKSFDNLKESDKRMEIPGSYGVPEALVGAIYFLGWGVDQNKEEGLQYLIIGFLKELRFGTESEAVIAHQILPEEAQKALQAQWIKASKKAEKK